MYSPGHSGASADARVGVETGVMGANPHRLIATLEEAWIGIAPAIAKMAAQPSPERIR
nr:hypothetical protein [Trinickia mobilis]